MAHTWKPLNFVAGGWTTTGIVRINSGTPFVPYLSDSNQLGDLTHTARPDVLPGAQMVNPLWSPSCPTGANCQPYVNPSAFLRPALGASGQLPAQ